MRSCETPVPAILLIGPTGAGKSPLGDYLEKKGLYGRRCIHFDFGNELRAVGAAVTPPDSFTRNEHAFIRDVLYKGLLLENRHFPIAEKIFVLFLNRRGFAAGDTLVLNGLPRHADQAGDMSRLADIRKVVVLECTADDVYERIGRNTGRDRTGRSDDGVEMIRKKLEIFRDRTAPLIEYFSHRGSVVQRIKVSSTSAAPDVYSEIASSAVFRDG